MATTKKDELTGPCPPVEDVGEDVESTEDKADFDVEETEEKA